MKTSGINLKMLIAETEKKKHNPGDQDVQGNIILNWVLKKHKVGCGLYLTFSG